MIYAVEIYNHDTGEVVKHLPARSLGQAERLENGAMRNLNHSRYSTRIVELPEEQGAKHVG